MSLAEDARHEAEVHVHDTQCHYLGNDMWDCGHMDGECADDCDCHICITPEDDPANPTRATHDNESDWWAEI